MVLLETGELMRNGKTRSQWVWRNLGPSRPILNDRYWTPTEVIRRVWAAGPSLVKKLIPEL
jgi:hypothetical protein